MGRPVLLKHFAALLAPVAGAFRVPSTAPAPAPTPDPTAPPVTLPTAFPALPPTAPEIVSAIVAVLNKPATINHNRVNFFIIQTLHMLSGS